MEAINILTKEVEDIKPIISERKGNYILSIPHGGIFIPLEFKDRYNIGESMLIATDLFTENLFDNDNGVKIVSNLNPFFVNVSRFREGGKEKNLPEHLRRTPLNEISLTGEEVLLKEHSREDKERILKYYNQYHSLLSKSIEEMKKKHGYALVFDCHSMNSKGMQNTPDQGEERADFVVGTLDDTSADIKIIDAFVDTLTEGSKLTVKKNYPYKGGFITQHYSSKDVHVIQLEVNKSVYMKGFGLSDGFEKVKDIISKAIEKGSEKAREIQ